MLSVYFVNTVAYSADHDNADDLCYDIDRVITEGSGCVDFGPFSGGFNCKKTIPIRNLSEETLDVTDILLDINGFNGEFLSACGIDGANETGKSCRYYAGLDREDLLPGIIGTGVKYAPMPNFTSKDEHSVFVYNLMKGAVDPLTMFGGDNLYTHYTKNGETYAGRIKACQRNAAPVDDLCYDKKAITYDSLVGGICMDFGPFKGGFACRQTIPIRSISNKDLSNVSLVLDQHGMNGDFLGDCGIDGVSKKSSGGCRDRKLFNFGPMGMMARGYLFEPMPSYAPFDKHSIFTRSLMEMQGDPVAFFTGKNMYVHYEKEGNTYEGYIPECTQYKEPVPDLCYDYDGIQYGLAHPPLGACAKFGPFKGGAGCKQTIPIRSSSGSSLTNMDIMLDTHGMNGNFLDDCGVDGNSKKVSILKPNEKVGCKSMDRFDFGPMGMFNKGVLYDQMVNYEPYGKHSIYTSAAMSMGGDIYTFLTGENLYTNYVKDGKFYSGRIPPCKKNYGKDLCRKDTKLALRQTGKGLFGIPIYGVVQETDIKSVTSKTLEHVTLLEDASAFFKFFDACGIDKDFETNRKCFIRSAISIGFGSFFSNGIYYDPMPNYSANATHSVFRKVSFTDLFISTNFFTSYLKDKEWYAYTLKKCSSVSAPNYSAGKFDAWDDYRVGLDMDRNIGTKVVDRTFNLSIASLNAEGDAYEYKDMATQVHFDLYNLDDSNNHYLIPNTHGTFDPSETSKFDQAFTVEKAYRKVDLGFTLCAARNGGITELHNDAECVADRSTAKDCDTLPIDDATQWCRVYSSDKFAVRPDRFKLELDPSETDSIFRAGKTYQYKITALSGDGIRIVDSYTQEGSNLDTLPTKFLSNGDEDIDNKLNGVLGFSDFNITNGVSYDGTANNYAAGIYYTDVGDIILSVEDQKWAEEDADDTPASCEGNQMFNGVMVEYGRYICANDRQTYIPDHFSVEDVRLYNHDQGTYTYLSNDLNMSAHIGLVIQAMSARGEITRNFNKYGGYYENPVKVELQLKSGLHPEGKSEIIHDIIPAIKLGFGGDTDANGTHTIDWNTDVQEQQLLFNYTRDNTNPTVPFAVNGKDVNITVTSSYGPEDVTGSAVAKSSDNAYFHYVKAKSASATYPDITSEIIETPIVAIVYCPFDTAICNAHAVNTSEISAYPGWYLSLDHNYALGYGDIVLKITDVSVGTASIQPDAKVEISSNGIDNDVKIKHETGDLPQSVKVDLDSATDSWMSASDSGFPVEFITAPTWAGEGKTGNVVDGNAYKRKNNRLSW